MIAIGTQYIEQPAGISQLVFHQLHQHGDRALKTSRQNHLAMNRFLSGVERRAFRMAEIATGNRDDALDIVQDAMLSLVKSYGHKTPDDWGPLFQRILQSRIRDWYRRSRVRNSLLDWLGVRVRGLSWMGLGALAALAAYTVALPVSALAGLRLGACGPLEDSGPWTLVTLLAAGVAAGLTVNAVAALGEEVGWRGYLLARLSSVAGFWPSALIVGVVWGLWHAPLVINGYDYSVSALEDCGGRVEGLVALVVFTIFTTAAGLVAALLRVGSGGAIAPAAMHGTINGIAGLYASLVLGSRLVAPPAGLAVAAGFVLVAPLVWWAVRSLAEEEPG